MGRMLFAFFLVAVSVQAKLTFMRETGKGKHIWIANDNGSQAMQVTQNDLWNLYPDLDASGRFLVWVRGHQGATEIVFKEISSGFERVLSAGDGLSLHPSFSGNGRRVVFSKPIGTRNQIHIRELDNEGPNRIIEDAHSCYFPKISSDGSFVIFQRDVDANTRVIVEYSLWTKTERILSGEYLKNMAPSLSADERFVAFTSETPAGWQVFVVDRMDGRRFQVTQAPGRNFAPTFKPSGDVVFASDRGGHFVLYRVEMNRWLAGPSEGRILLQMDGELYAPNFSGAVELESQTLPEIPTPARSSFGAVRLGNSVYVVGGHQGHEHTYPESSFLDRVDILDLKTGAWRQGSRRNIKSHGLGLATYGKYIYAFGGFAFATPEQVFTPKWRSLNVIERYDTERDIWEVVGKLPRRRSSNVVAVVDGKAYLIGGWDSTPRFDKDFDGVFQRKIDVFDLATETVVEYPHDLPDPLRRAFTGVVRNNEVWLVGGLGQGATHFDLLDRVTIFDPRNGHFREAQRLPFPTFAPAAGFLQDSLFVFGGMYKVSEKDYTYVGHIFRMDVKGDGWGHTGRYLLDARGFAQVVSVDDTLLVMGGHTYHGEEDAPVPTVEKFSRKHSLIVDTIDC